MDGILFNKDQTEIIRYPEGKPDKNYTIPSSVSDVSSQAFDGCTNLAEINVAEENIYYSSLDGILFNKDQTEIIRYPAGKLNTDYIIPFGVTDIICGAFRYCTSLIDITIPNSVTTIEDGAFCHCTSLKKIFIPESVIFLGFMTGIVFEGCDSLTIYGYAGTAAETYAKENGFDFIGLDKKVDSATGISVAEKELNIIPDGSEIKTALLSAEDNRIVFDISLIKDGSEVQPNGEVTVKIPVPERMVGSLLKVYRKEADGSLTDMNAYFADGSMIFTTDHFSKYIITAEESVSVLKGDVNGDGTVDAADAVLVQRYDAGMINLSKTQLKAADVNSDGTVDAADAVLIMRFDAGLIDRL